MNCHVLDQCNKLEAECIKLRTENSRIQKVLIHLNQQLKPEKLIMTVTKDGKELKIYETYKVTSVQKQRDLVRQFMREEPTE